MKVAFRLRNRLSASQWRSRLTELGIGRQIVRFLLVGGSAALIYLLATTLLAEVAGLSFQLALGLGASIALAMHFTLQRVFVWVHDDGFALPLRSQAGRYLLAAGAQYGITAASIAILPSVLSLQTELVYLATVAVVVPANYFVFRSRIFHPGAADSEERAVTSINVG